MLASFYTPYHFPASSPSPFLLHLQILPHHFPIHSYASI
jgi:hypothetical protein